MSKLAETFATPAELFEFIRDMLIHSDVDRLCDAPLEPVPAFWRERIFADLAEIESTNTLEAVFLTNKQFPTDSTEYTLGEHSNRTRHLHLDLVRQDQGWRLLRIWKCR